MLVVANCSARGRSSSVHLAMAPPSSTTISSIASSPARRWVMSSADRPVVAFSRSARIASAVGGSRCSPGSSRTAPGSRAAARGRAQPLALAAGQASAVRAGLGLEAGGQRVDPVVEADAGAARRRARPSVASRRARRRFSSSVVSKTCASWATRPTARAHVVAVEAVESRRRRASTEPLVVEEAQQHGGERRLARAAGADDGDAAARARGRGRRRRSAACAAPG